MQPHSSCLYPGHHHPFPIWSLSPYLHSYSLQCVFQLQLVSSFQNADLVVVKAKESESKVAQSCPTLCDPVDCSLWGFFVHGILQERILEWVTISFSRRSSQPRDWTRVSPTVSRRFAIWATRGIQFLLGRQIWRPGIFSLRRQFYSNFTLTFCH